MKNQKTLTNMNNAVKIIIVAALALAIILVVFLKQTTSPNAVVQVDVHNQANTNNTEKSPNSLTVAQESESLPALIDLGAGKCIPCKLMAPILKQIKNDFADRLRVEVIDIEENPDLINKYHVRVIPTQIFFDASGKELFRHEGFYSREDILAKFKELGVELK
jgi:thioredoxin 1